MILHHAAKTECTKKAKCFLEQSSIRKVSTVVKYLSEWRLAKSAESVLSFFKDKTNNLCCLMMGPRPAAVQFGAESRFFFSLRIMRLMSRVESTQASTIGPVKNCTDRSHLVNQLHQHHANTLTTHPQLTFYLIVGYMVDIFNSMAEFWLEMFITTPLPISRSRFFDC